MCVLLLSFSSSSLTFDTISISSQTMTVIIIFTISYFSFSLYVFSGRSNRKSLCLPCVLFKNQQKIFFFEFSWNFTFFKIEKVWWLSVSLKEITFFILSRHRPLYRHFLNFVVPLLRKLIFSQRKQRFIAFDKKPFPREIVFCPFRHFLFNETRCEGGFILFLKIHEY